MTDYYLDIMKEISKKDASVTKETVLDVWQKSKNDWFIKDWNKNSTKTHENRKFVITTFLAWFYHISIRK